MSGVDGIVYFPDVDPPESRVNNVNYDPRGYIYALDRANTGLHILELTGSAREVAGLPPR